MAPMIQPSQDDHRGLGGAPLVQRHRLRDGRARQQQQQQQPPSEARLRRRQLLLPRGQGKEGIPAAKKWPLFVERSLRLAFVPKGQAKECGKISPHTSLVGLTFTRSFFNPQLLGNLRYMPQEIRFKLLNLLHARCARKSSLEEKGGYQ